MKRFSKGAFARILGGIMSVCLLFGALGLSSEQTSETTVSASSSTSVNFDENDIQLTFGNFSDTHIGYGNNDSVLRNALSVVKSYAKNGIDALLFDGDQTQDGKEEQAKKFISILEEQFDLTKTAAVITNGNHDTYWSGCMNTAQFAAAFGEKVYTFDVDKESYTTGNRHVKVGNYHFLTVQVQTFMPNINNLSADTKTWLKSTLDSIVAEDPNSYIFVSCHSPAKNTVYGSMDDQDTGPWGASADLETALKDYPQVVLFTGHTHYALNDERVINQTTYTQVHSGSTSDLDTDKGYLENMSGGVSDRRTYSQAMLVEVDGSGNIRITRLDCKQGKQVKGYWYLDAYSADGSHLTRYSAATREAENVAPSFSDTAKITAKELSSSSMQITFPAASDDDMVYYYNVSVIDKDGKEYTSVKTLSPWYKNPDLSTLPATHSVTLTSSSFAYPYTIKVVAYDSFSLGSEPLVLEMKDTTEEDKATAAALDARISALQGRELLLSDGEEVTALRSDINDLSYKTKGYMKNYKAFLTIEASYYNQFYLTEDAAQFAPTADKTFNGAATTSKGWTAASKYTGVSLNWSSTTKNNSLGFTDTVALDGLHISFANLSITSENKVFALILSNKMKDKWLSGENFLLYVDFADGTIRVNSGVSVGESSYLIYDKIGATPFDVVFEQDANGDLLLKVHTVLGDESFSIGAENLTGLPNLTDLTKCYLSFTPWAAQTSGSFDVTAVHGGDKDCLQYVKTDVDQPNDEPNAPDTSDDQNASDVATDDSSSSKTSSNKGSASSSNKKSSGCGNSVYSGAAALSLGVAGALLLKKKKENDREEIKANKS